MNPAPLRVNTFNTLGPHHHTTTNIPLEQNIHQRSHTVTPILDSTYIGSLNSSAKRTTLSPQDKAQLVTKLYTAGIQAEHKFIHATLTIQRTHRGNRGRIFARNTRARQATHHTTTLPHTLPQHTQPAHRPPTHVTNTTTNSVNTTTPTPGQHIMYNHYNNPIKDGRTLRNTSNGLRPSTDSQA